LRTPLSMPSCAARRRFMEPPMAEMLNIEVCYAMANKQELVRVSLPEGALLQQALEASGLLAKYPEIDLKKNKFGIWNKLSKPESVLRDKDRVEIYRALIADPKEVRKQRAAEGKVMKKGAGDTDASAEA
jgi:putative ubiquitin-RnfH superfamily antitoxin RatB of RatAB toxin-antitoxin module